jgi:hypothetical protein
MKHLLNDFNHDYVHCYVPMLLFMHAAKTRKSVPNMAHVGTWNQLTQPGQVGFYILRLITDRRFVGRLRN